MAAIMKGLWLECAVLLLAADLWLVVAPSSLGRDFSPAELIEKALPGKVTIKTASKSDFLEAVCMAVRKNRGAAAEITSAAVAAHEEIAGEIVGTVLRCTRKPDCAFVGAVVKAAVTARPAAGTTISDAAMARAPNCSETIQAAVSVAAQSEAGPASSTGPRTATEENFDPHEQLVLICADGVQRAIRQSLVDEFRRAHPASFLGSCPPPAPVHTPTPARTPGPALAPAPLP